LAERVLAEVGGSRSTVRLFQRDGSVVLAGEALAPGIPSMKDSAPFSLTSAGTYQHLSRARGLLVQEDCRTAKPAPPPELITHHNVLAQVVGAVISDDGQMVATLAVHQVGSTRRWTPAEIAAVERGVRDLEEIWIASAF
jgi:GAF domain-containing protein